MYLRRFLYKSASLGQYYYHYSLFTMLELHEAVRSGLVECAISSPPLTIVATIFREHTHGNNSS